MQLIAVKAVAPKCNLKMLLLMQDLRQQDVVLCADM